MGSSGSPACWESEQWPEGGIPTAGDVFLSCNCRHQLGSPVLTRENGTARLCACVCVVKLKPFEINFT